MAVAIEETAKAAKAETRAATHQAHDPGYCRQNLSRERTNPGEKIISDVVENFQAIIQYPLTRDFKIRCYKYLDFRITYKIKGVC